MASKLRLPSKEPIQGDQDIRAGGIDPKFAASGAPRPVFPRLESDPPAGIRARQTLNKGARCFRRFGAELKLKSSFEVKKLLLGSAGPAERNQEANQITAHVLTQRGGADLRSANCSARSSARSLA